MSATWTWEEKLTCKLKMAGIYVWTLLCMRNWWETCTGFLCFCKLGIKISMLLGFSVLFLFSFSFCCCLISNAIWKKKSFLTAIFFGKQSTWNKIHNSEKAEWILNTTIAINFNNRNLAFWLVAQLQNPQIKLSWRTYQRLEYSHSQSWDALGLCLIWERLKSFILAISKTNWPDLCFLN